MEQITFIHCADIHMGYGYQVSGFADAKKMNIRRDDLKKVFRKVVDYARFDKASFVVFSGTFLDTVHMDNDNMSFLTEQCKENADIRFIIVPESDVICEHKHYQTLRTFENVTLLNSKSEPFYLKEENTYIYPCNQDSIHINFSEAAFQTERFQAQRFQAKDPFRILVCTDIAHGAMLRIPEMLQTKKIDIVMAGCPGKRAKDQFVADGVYCLESPEPLSSMQTDPCGIHSVTLTQDAEVATKQIIRQVVFLETAHRSYRKISLDITGCFTPEAIKDLVVTTIDPNQTDIYCLEITGIVSPFETLDSNAIAEELQDVFFDVIVNIEKVTSYDLESEKSLPGIKNVYIKELQREIQAAQTEAEKEMLKRALFFGLSALKGDTIIG